MEELLELYLHSLQFISLVFPFGATLYLYYIVIDLNGVQ